MFLAALNLQCSDIYTCGDLSFCYYWSANAFLILTKFAFGF